MALAAIGFMETRHQVWSLMDIYHENPFSGPSDTTRSFPYANQILDLTKEFIVEGSCPDGNPVYPVPSQGLPGNGTEGFVSGDELVLGFEFEPAFVVGGVYWVVYSHGLFNISVPFDVQMNITKVPQKFESRGVVIALVADEIGAPMAESVLAGPLLLFQQPVFLNLV